MNEALVEQSRRAIGLIPEGCVVSYGDLAELLGISPRQAGRLLRDHSQGLPWWRVTSATGDLPMLDRAREHWARENIHTKANGRGCRIREHRADLAAWADAYDATKPS